MSSHEKKFPRQVKKVITFCYIDNLQKGSVEKLQD